MHFLTAKSNKQNHTFPLECALFRRQIFRSMCTFQSQHVSTKSHLSFRMCGFSAPNSPMNVYFFAATRTKKIKHFLQNVHFFASAFSNSSKQASKIQPFHRNVHFFAATRTRKITPYLPNVHFFASAKCTFSPQRATSKITPFLQNVRFFAARFFRSMCTFQPQHDSTKSHLSFGMCAFSPPNSPKNLNSFTATRTKKNHPFPPECALNSTSRFSRTRNDVTISYPFHFEGCSSILESSCTASLRIPHTLLQSYTDFTFTNSLHI